MIYVVLGMHKSGTTLVSQILHHSGVNMGDNIDDNVTYDKGNKYERESSLRLDMNILNVKDFYVLDLKTPDPLRLQPEHRERMRAIIKQCNLNYSNWGFKDPRATLIYPLWAEELPEHKIIAVFRPPAEIWPRFRYNGLRYFHTNPQRAWEFMSRWCEHNQKLLSCLQNTSMKFIVLNYRELVTTQVEFERLQKFMGIPLTDRRRPGLYRARSQNTLFLKFMTQLFALKNGCSPEKLIEQLEALRR